MFKQLLLTELDANRWLLLFNAALNGFLLVLLGAMNQRPLVVFIFATAAVYFVHLLIMTVNNSDQRRTRLYAQLPVSSLQVFWAQWLFCLGWLGTQALVWLLYGLLFDPAFSSTGLNMIAHALVGMVLVLAIVSIEIDLFAYHPVCLRWAYLAVAAVMLALAVSYEIDVGLQWDDNTILLEPFARFGWPGLLSALLLIVVLIAVDRHVFSHSENYLS